MKIEYEYVIYDKSFIVLENGKGLSNEGSAIDISEDILLKTKTAVFADINEVRIKGKLKLRTITCIASQYKSTKNIVITNYK